METPSCRRVRVRTDCGGSSLDFVNFSVVSHFVPSQNKNARFEAEQRCGCGCGCWWCRPCHSHHCPAQTPPDPCCAACDPRPLRWFSLNFFPDSRIRIYDTENAKFKLVKTIEAKDVGWSVIDTAFRLVCKNLTLFSCHVAERLWSRKRFLLQSRWQFPGIL